jgi:DNA helicase-4
MILNMTEGAYGFPSQLSEDPILRLVLPENEDFPMSEERRVFYVALTRAKRQVRIYTKTSAPSRFLVEMLRNGMLDVRLASGGKLTACPQCSGGILTARSGLHGPFEGCDCCDFTRNLPSDHKIEVGERISLRTPIAPGTICPTCGKGIMKERPAPFKPFVGCSRHPKCQTTAPLQA